MIKDVISYLCGLVEYSVHQGKYQHYLLSWLRMLFMVSVNSQFSGVHQGKSVHHSYWMVQNRIGQKLPLGTKPCIVCLLSHVLQTSISILIYEEISRQSISLSSTSILYTYMLYNLYVFCTIHKDVGSFIDILGVCTF